jgi:hypothetical protein
MTDILGVTIPSGSRIFLTIIGFHVVAGLACVVTGLVTMLSEKRKGRHPTSGTIYFWCLAFVCASSSALSLARWAEDYHLFLLGALAFVSAFFGRSAMQRRWPGWVRHHIVGMGASYILLLTAFYVDNGESLPGWRELPAIAYWIVPGVVGVPIIVWALLRHPLTRPIRTSR